MASIEVKSGSSYVKQAIVNYMPIWGGGGDSRRRSLGTSTTHYGTRYHTKISGGTTLDNFEALSTEKSFRLVPNISKWHHILPYLKHVPIK